MDSKVALGAFRTGKSLGACYEDIFAIPVEQFPTSIREMTCSLDEAVAATGSDKGDDRASNFSANVAVAFSAAAAKRAMSRQQVAKSKAETLELARQRWLEQKDEVESHRTAMRIAATKERAKESQRKQEIERCRSEAYHAEWARVEAQKRHICLMEQAIADGNNEARYERALSATRSVENDMRVDRRKAGRRSEGLVGPARPRHVDAAAHGRCAKNSKSLRAERSGMVAKACEALCLARKNVRSAMDVPYPDEKSRQKMLKGREMVLSALTELGGLVDDPAG